MDLNFRIFLVLVSLFLCEVAAKEFTGIYSLDGLSSPVPDSHDKQFPTLYLQKMQIYSGGKLTIKVSPFTTNPLLSSSPRKLPSHLYVYALQEQDYQLISRTQTKKCQEILAHTTSRINIQQQEVQFLLLKQSRPHLWYFFMVFCPRFSSQERTDEYVGNGGLIKVELSITHAGGHHIEQSKLLQLGATLSSLALVFGYAVFRRYTTTTKNTATNNSLISTSLYLVYLVSMSLELVFQVASMYYFETYGKTNIFLNSLAVICGVTLTKYVLYCLLSLQFGWKVLLNKDDVADMISGLIICYGTLQLVLSIMYLRGRQDIDVLEYTGSFYFLVEILFNVMFYVASIVGMYFMERRKATKKRQDRLSLVHWEILVKLHGVTLAIFVAIPLGYYFCGQYGAGLRIVQTSLSLFAIYLIQRISGNNSNYSKLKGS